MVRDSVQLETAVNTITHKYLLEFTSEYGISKMLRLKLPGPRDRIVDFPEGKAEASGQETAAPEVPLPEEVPVTTVPGGDHATPIVVEPPPVQESRKRGREGIDANAPPKSLRRDHADLQPAGEKVLLICNSIWLLTFLCMKVSMRMSATLIHLLLLTLHHPLLRMLSGVAAAGDPGSKNVSSPTVVGSPGSVYRPEWVSPMVAFLIPPRPVKTLLIMLLLRATFLSCVICTMTIFLGSNLARQVAMGSQLRLRFEQEAKLLRKSVAQVARREQRIQARESEIKNLEVLLETEADMKRAAKEKSVGLIKSWKRCQVSGEETLKAAFEDYMRQQDQMVEQRCAEMDARLDAMSIDFDKELYPHMLTAIVGHMWVIGHGLRLATMKCAESLEMRQAFVGVVSAGIAKGMSEGLKHGVEHGHAQRMIESLEAYDPEAEAKFAAALQSLKDLKLPLLDQLEGLKDAPMDVIMASLDDAPQFIRDLRPSSSQLAIPVYPESCGTEKEKPHSMPNSWGRLSAPCQ
nr:hypothetical protein [Tanacetum cinerariifolium]